MQLEAFCFLATRDDGVRESSASTAVPVLVQWHLVEQDSKVSMATMEAATTMYYKYITANTKKEENMIQSHNRSGGSRWGAWLSLSPILEKKKEERKKSQQGKRYSQINIVSTLQLRL